MSSTPAVLYCGCLAVVCSAARQCGEPRHAGSRAGGSDADAPGRRERGHDGTRRARPATPAPAGRRAPPDRGSAGTTGDARARPRRPARPAARAPPDRRPRRHDGNAGRGGTTAAPARAASAGTTGQRRLRQLHVHAVVGDQHDDRGRSARSPGRPRSSGATSAKIDFGLTTSYGMSAPVAAVTASNKTMLLGMKYAKMYHYRITATSGSGSCQSDDYTLMTGALPTGLQKPTVTTSNASALSGGFLVTGQYTMNAGSRLAGVHPRRRRRLRLGLHGAQRRDRRDHGLRRNAHVDQQRQRAERLGARSPRGDGRLDRRGSLGPVRGRQPPADRAARRDGRVLRVRLERLRRHQGARAERHGQDDRQLPHRARRHRRLPHQQHPVLADDETLVFSDLDNNCLTKVTRTGTVRLGAERRRRAGIANGSPATPGWAASTASTSSASTSSSSSTTTARSPGGATTTATGTNDGSIALEIKLDLTAKKATKAWMYKGSGTSFQNDVMGDVQRLPNGNTIIAFSTKGHRSSRSTRREPCCRQMRTTVQSSATFTSARRCTARRRGNPDAQIRKQRTSDENARQPSACPVASVVRVGLQQQRSAVRVDHGLHQQRRHGRPAAGHLQRARASSRRRPTTTRSRARSRSRP